MLRRAHAVSQAIRKAVVERLASTSATCSNIATAFAYPSLRYARAAMGLSSLEGQSMNAPGAFRNNNPSGAALTELESAEWLSPTHDAVLDVACLVSVGTGRPTFEYKKPGMVSKMISEGY